MHLYWFVSIAQEIINHKFFARNIRVAANKKHEGKALPLFDLVYINDLSKSPPAWKLVTSPINRRRFHSEPDGTLMETLHSQYSQNPLKEYLGLNLIRNVPIKMRVPAFHKTYPIPTKLYSADSGKIRKEAVKPIFISHLFY